MNQIPIKVLKEQDKINPWNYYPTQKQMRERIENQKDLVPFTTLVTPYNQRISRRSLREKPSRELMYLEIGDFDPETREFTPSTRIIGTLPSRATYELNGVI